LTGRLADSLRRILPKNKFARSVSVLVGGTAGSQAIMVLVLPFLTRLYTPDDFAVLAIYTSIFGILVSVACLRFEIAIPLPKTDAVAINLLALALCFPLIITCSTWLLITFAGGEFARLLGQEKAGEYFWLIPLGIWLAGSYRALQYWSMRTSNFTLVAKTKFTESLGCAGMQLLFGISGIAPLGLLLGLVLRFSAGIIALGCDLLTKHLAVVKTISLQGMRSAFREYHRFPKYSTFEALANSAGVQLPVLLIASVVVGPEVGFLALATRAMAAPMGLIGKAVSQVYLTTAPDHYRNGLLGKHTAEVIGGLCKTGVGPLLFAGITAPYLFPIIFGVEWTRAGEIVTWMTPWFVMQFLVSPVSMTLHVAGQQRTALVLQIAGFVLRAGAVVCATLMFESYIVETYAITGFLFYSLYLFVVARIVGIKFPALRSEIPYKVLFGWVTFAFLCLTLLTYHL
jgi:O-antigen/teichoic acid export membrane protein